MPKPDSQVTSRAMEKADEMASAILQAARDTANYIRELELQLREAHERIAYLERQQRQ